MHTELTFWVHLQVASSAIQLMNKTCRQNSLSGCICRWPHQPSSSWKNMQTELTTWVHLQVASSAIQLIKKACRQNSLPGCICRWCHQPSSSWIKHADRTHSLGAFAGASSVIQLVKNNTDSTHILQNLVSPITYDDTQTHFLNIFLVTVSVNTIMTDHNDNLPPTHIILLSLAFAFHDKLFSYRFTLQKFFYFSFFHSNDWHLHTVTIVSPHYIYQIKTLTSWPNLFVSL